MKTPTVLKSYKTTDPFVRVPIELINNPELSWQAKGVISYMLSKPQDWRFYVADICGHSTDGDRCVRSALTELRKMGYARLIRVTSKGKTIAWQMHVSDTAIFPKDDSSITIDILNLTPDRCFADLQNAHVQNSDLLVRSTRSKIDSTVRRNLGSVADATRSLRKIKIPRRERPSRSSFLNYVQKKQFNHEHAEKFWDERDRKGDWNDSWRKRLDGWCEKIGRDEVKKFESCGL